VLSKFEADFAPFATAVESGEFALWVGSGISRQAPDLGRLIERAFDFVRQRAVTPATAATYMPALEEALGLAEVNPASVQARLDEPLATWPERDAIIERLWNKYSRVLDIRIPGEDSDFVLWEAIDIRAAFENPPAPAAEHLCIALLVLEGAVQSIASANWDGFIEAAINRLSNGLGGVMQVIVDPDQLRGAPGRARLFKFHGCIVHATHEPAVFRRYLTGSYTQIMNWPETAQFAAMRNAIVNLATTQKTLVLGLSIQDNNLQTIFARANQVHAWPWPCTPNAPGHVFCEESIRQGQRDVLRLTYGEAYNNDPAAVHTGTHLRAWGEQVLIALVLKLLTDKLNRLMTMGLGNLGKADLANGLSQSLIGLRDAAADLAVGNRTEAVSRGIALWSRMLSLFRRGALAPNTDAYEVLSSFTPNLIGADQNAQAMALDRLGVALALLEQGRSAGLWELKAPASNDVTAGAMTARGARPDGVDRPVFIVRSATEAIALKSIGALANDNAIVIHADDTWRQFTGGSGSPRRVRAGPGRTGFAGETHVSLGHLISRADDAATLQQDFISDMIL